MRIGIVTFALLASFLGLLAPPALADEGADALSAPPPRAPSATRLTVPEAPRESAAGAETIRHHVDAPRARELRYLQSSLAYLAYQESNPIVDGLLHTVMGGVWIGFGTGLPGLDPAIRAYYLVQGSSMLARAGIAFAIRPNARGANLEMDAMRSGSPSEADARIAYGAGALAKLAKQHRIKRLLGSTLSIASGVLPLPFVLGSSTDVTNGWSIIVFVGAGIDIITGIIGLSVRTEAEKRHIAYEEMRAKSGVDEVSVGFMPLIGGGGLRLQVRYH